MHWMSKMQTAHLRMNYEFSRIYRKGRFVAGRHVVLHYLRRPGNPKRLGVTTSRQVRSSVRRNRIKRLLRESYREIENQVPEGYDLILVGRNTAELPGYTQIQSDVLKLLRRAGLIQIRNGCM